MKPVVWLFDLDDTLFDNTHRKHYIVGKAEPDWLGFHLPEEMAKDVPMPWTEGLFQDGNFKYGKHAFLTARDIRAYQPSCQQIWKYGFWNKEDLPDLHMKPETEERGPHFKVRWILQELEKDEEVTLVMIEDRNDILTSLRTLRHDRIHVVDSLFTPKYDIDTLAHNLGLSNG